MAKEANIIVPLALLGGFLLLTGGTKDKTPTPAPTGTFRAIDYIKKYWQSALISQRASTVPALFTITQGGVESGWGRSTPGNNHFGIHADRGWDGPVVMSTDAGRPTKFRAYPNVAASFMDHDRFLLVNPRYRAAFQYTRDPIRFAIEVAKAGYAENPNYASILTGAMKMVAQVLIQNKMV